MVKKFLVILTIFSLNIGCEVEDSCETAVQKFYKITGFSIENLQLSDRGYDFAQPIADGTTIAFDEFALSILPGTELLAVIEAQKPKSSFSMIQPAMACTMPPPAPSENLSEVTVFSDADYLQEGSNTILAAGDTLNGLFQIADFQSGLITGLPNIFKRGRDIAAAEDGFYLMPTAKPAQNATHRFTIHYRLENGEKFTFQSPPVTITP